MPIEVDRTLSVLIVDHGAFIDTLITKAAVVVEVERAVEVRVADKALELHLWKAAPTDVVARPELWDRLSELAGAKIEPKKSEKRSGTGFLGVFKRNDRNRGLCFTVMHAKVNGGTTSYVGNAWVGALAVAAARLSPGAALRAARPVLAAKLAAAAAAKPSG